MTRRGCFENQNSQDTSRLGRYVRGLRSAGWWGTVSNRGNRDEQLVFALLRAFSAIATISCLAIPLMHQLSERSSRAEATDFSSPSFAGTMLQSIQWETRSFPCLVAALALLTTFFLYHRTTLLNRTISSAMLCLMVLYAYRICFMTVRYTDQEIRLSHPVRPLLSDTSISSSSMPEEAI